MTDTIWQNFAINIEVADDKTEVRITKKIKKY